MSKEINFNLNEWVDKQIEQCYTAFEGGNKGAILDVLYYCNEYQKPLPKWAINEQIKIRKLPNMIL